jgi:hypothetical protein
MTDFSLDKIWIEQHVIQTVFNNGQFYDRLRSGELYASLHENSLHLSRRLARTRQQPYCTRSQILSYYDQNGTKVAVVHQYRKRDGTLGGSGLPDPKWLRLNDKILWTD